MKLIIVRHAEPDYSKDSLTEKGFHEADLLAERMAKLPMDDIYVSPLGRAQDTARPTLERTGKTAKTVAWLREFEGCMTLPYNGMEQRCWDFLPSWFTREDSLYDPERWLTGAMDSGNVREEYRMVCEGVDEVLAAHGYTRDGRLYRTKLGNTDTVVFFCHYGVESIILSHLFSCSPVLFLQNFVALPSSVTVLCTEEREKGNVIFRCSALGDTSHLYAGDEPLSFAGRFCETYENFAERHE